MTFSVITPSFNQLDWLRLCVASVRDQVGVASNAMGNGEYGNLKAETGKLKPENPLQVSSFKSQVSRSPLAVEHIIQDAGSPGIEGFAREVGAAFYRDGVFVFPDENAKCEMGSWKLDESQHGDELQKSISKGTRPYRLAIFSERDKGMYDAINRGLEKSSGEVCAWLNCDEQYLPGTLAKVAKIFTGASDLDVLLGDALLTDASHRPVCYRRIMVPYRWHTRLDHLHSLSCAMFFKRSALPSPPLDPRWKVIGDAVLMDHFLGSGKKIRACGDLLSAYAFTGRNLSANPAHNEHAKWLEEAKWPPGFLRPLVVLQNRLRRMAHGAYGSFRVEAGLFSPDSLMERVATSATVPGTWPDRAG